MQRLKFRLIRALFAALSLCAGLQGWPQKAVTHAKTVITPHLMKTAIDFLASDSMKGRGTPSPELDLAAGYIAGQFESLGLLKANGSYFQDIDYCFCDLAGLNFISVVEEGHQTRNYNLKNDFIPFTFSGGRAAEGGIVFAGYGITAPEYGYDDYGTLDVRGKIVVVLDLEPGQRNPAGDFFNGKRLTRYSNAKMKQKAAMDRGAAALLVISGSSALTHSYWPSLREDVAGMDPPVEHCGWSETAIPAVQVGKSMVLELFGGADSLQRMIDRMEDDRQGVSFRIPRKIMAMNVSFHTSPVNSRNVIAWMEGSDPDLKDEAVIIGAHYDHLGVLKRYSPGSDSVFNGADDNASGTGGMLAVAKAFATMPKDPLRSVIFIAFTGEEWGFLGSNSYVRNPYWPIDRTVAMLNLDMISRNHPDSLLIKGGRQASALAKVIRRNNRETGFTLVESSARYFTGGSDHAPFVESGVPAVFFFTGLHEDYHQVSDDPSRVDAEKAARVARLVFLTAWSIANEKKHYKIEDDPKR